MQLVLVRGKVLYSISLSVLPAASTLFAGFAFKGWPMKRPLRTCLVYAHRASSTRLALLKIHSTVREGKGELGSSSSSQNPANTTLPKY